MLNMNKCKKCNIDLKPHKQNKTYCSLDCYYKSGSVGGPKMGVKKNCLCCGKEMYIYKSRVNKQKYCNKECFDTHQTLRRVVNCNNCNCKIERRPSLIKINKNNYCSIECHKDYKTKNARSIKEQRLISANHRRLRVGGSQATARKLAFAMKPNECEICGYKKYSFCLDLHHKDKNPANNNIDNLAILCCICHRKLHKNIIGLDSIKKSAIEQAQEIIKLC